MACLFCLKLFKFLAIHLILKCLYVHLKGYVFVCIQHALVFMSFKNKCEYDYGACGIVWRLMYRYFVVHIHVHLHTSNQLIKPYARTHRSSKKQAWIARMHFQEGDTLLLPHTLLFV